MTVPGNLVAPLLASASSPWTFVAAGANSVGANPSVALPAGWQQGDLLVVLCGQNVSTLTAPSGYSTACINVGSTLFLSCFYKIAGSSESNATMTGGSLQSEFVMLCYRNIAASPFDVVGTVATGSSVSPANTTLTTTAAGDLVISLYTNSTNNSTWTAPGSTNSRVNVSSALTSHVGLLVVDENQVSAGASSVRTATQSVSQAWAAIQIAFKNA